MGKVILQHLIMDVLATRQEWGQDFFSNQSHSTTGMTSKKNLSMVGPFTLFISGEWRVWRVHYRERSHHFQTHNAFKSLSRPTTAAANQCQKALLPNCYSCCAALEPPPRTRMSISKCRADGCGRALMYMVSSLSLGPQTPTLGLLDRGLILEHGDEIRERPQLR